MKKRKNKKDHRAAQQQQLIALTDLDEIQAAGLPFKSEAAVRWDYTQRFERGTERAYINIGRRIFIDPVRYHKAVRKESI